MTRYRAAAFLFLVAGSITMRASAAPDDAAQKFPDVIAVEVHAGDGTDRFDFDVTVSSPYDTPQRYADGFRVADRDGRVFGERKLLHDHANEQPFIRDLYGVVIPRDVRTVVIQARDQQHGYGGKTFEATLPGR